MIAPAQIGRRFTSEKMIINDTSTGIRLTFLTSMSNGYSRFCKSNLHWTADGKWIIFRSSRIPGETLAVNEKTGSIVQVSEGSYMGVVGLSHRSMKFYFMRMVLRQPGQKRGGPVQIVEVDLEKLFHDSETGQLKKEHEYQKVCGTIPAEADAGGYISIDADEGLVYFRIGREEASRNFYSKMKTGSNFRSADPGEEMSGICSMNRITGMVQFVVAVPFQITSIQANPWVPGEIVFSTETNDEGYQRIWTVNSDGSGLRHLCYGSLSERSASVTIINRDEAAFITKNPGSVRNEASQGNVAGDSNPADQSKAFQEQQCKFPETNDNSEGIAIVNLRSGELTHSVYHDSGSGFWRVNCSADGKWAAWDDSEGSVYLFDRQTRDIRLVYKGNKMAVTDHPSPTFNPDGTKIGIQSAMLSKNGRTMNICIIPVPDDWLKRQY